MNKHILKHFTTPITVVKVAEKAKVSRATAYSVVSFLHRNRLLRKVGEVRQGRRGCASSVYHITVKGRGVLT